MALRLALSTCTILLLVTAPLQAQTAGIFGEVEASGTSYYEFVRPGEATVEVLVLGNIGSAGIYRVGKTTDLDELLALTGGIGLAPNTQQVAREVTIRLFREGRNQRRLIYKASMDSLIAKPGAYPTLQNGDVLKVEVVEHTRFSWRDGLEIVSSVGTLVLIAERLISLYSRNP